MKKIFALIKLLRPHQYTKNFFLFFPMFFAGKLGETDALVRTVQAFFCFSFCASGVYVLNDALDRRSDQEHPTKCKRPIASGEVKLGEAIVLMLLLWTGSFYWLYLVEPEAVSIMGAYVVMNILYSLKLKHISVLDVSILATGFVLRLFLGSSVSGIELSHWIILMTFLLALFLGLAKRRDDVLIYLKGGGKTRKVVDGYNLEFLSVSMMVMSSVMIMTYVLYTVSPEVEAKFGKDLYLTSGFVVMGVMRYMQQTFVYESSGSPTKVLLTDHFLQLVILAFIATFSWLLYY